MGYPRWRSSVLAGLFILLYTLPVDTAGSQEQEQEQEPALLETRISWGRSVPVFPANTARFFRGRYDLNDISVDVYVIEDDPTAGLPIPAVPGGDSADVPDVWATMVSCGSVDLAHFASRSDGEGVTMEVRVPPGGGTGSGPTILPFPYRLVLRLGSAVDTGTVCSFATAFLELFEYFRFADTERGRPLTFSGGRIPEFPAVVELSQ